ncbi:hypothetical protein [Brevibacillus invocatus]|uniref:hypothetical protein n=1 Tax=Brevibacillus invocatus TaxID=173959 RepID=UPI0016057592|nr:hypothetical protein [Brevibacillus invocatus]
MERKARKQTQFTYTEQNGILPIEEWLISALKTFAKTKYGISLEVYYGKEE